MGIWMHTICYNKCGHKKCAVQKASVDVNISYY